MHARRMVALCASLLSVVAACGDDSNTSATTSTSSSGSASSSSSSGVGGGGGGSGGQGGMGVPLAGLGEISGMCGEIEPRELVANTAGFIVENELNFGRLAFDDMQLSQGGMKLFADPNLGGSSKFSEIFAYEMLYRCELAALLKSEAEIIYDVNGKKTDMLVEIDGIKVGVSVVRAYKPNPPYTVDDAQAILTSKLSDILESTDNVAPGDSWNKQILHVIAFEPEHLAAVQQAYPLIDPAIRADTIVIVTLTSGNDLFIYTE